MSVFLSFGLVVSSFGALVVPPCLCCAFPGVPSRWGGSPPVPRLRGLSSSSLLAARVGRSFAVVGWRLFRLLSAFLLVFCLLCLLLFCVWGGFFACWGGVFVGWGGGFVPFFFVALFRGRFLLFGSCPVPLGGCRGSCVRVVSRVRLVRAGGLACPGVARASPVGARRRRLPPFRRLAVWPSRLLLVGGLVGRCCLCCFAGCVGRLGWRSRWRRPAVAFFVNFFNFCRCFGVKMWL